MTETALPQALIGALIGTAAWLPERTPPRPEVRLLPFRPLPLFSTEAPPWEEALELPRTPTALPLMSTGREIGRLAWLPLPTPPSPEVSAIAVPLPKERTATASRAAGAEALTHVRMSAPEV